MYVRAYVSMCVRMCDHIWIECSRRFTNEILLHIIKSPSCVDAGGRSSVEKWRKEKQIQRKNDKLGLQTFGCLFNPRIQTLCSALLKQQPVYAQKKKKSCTCSQNTDLIKRMELIGFVFLYGCFSGIYFLSCFLHTLCSIHSIFSLPFCTLLWKNRMVLHRRSDAPPICMNVKLSCYKVFCFSSKR